MGGIGGSAGQILAYFQEFGEAVVAAGAQILNDFINVLAGSAAQDLVIDEFSTQNTYLYTDDAYIDALHNTERIVLNSLIRGTSITDEVIDFYRKAYSSSDFNLQKALDIVDGSDSVHNNATYTPLSPTISCNFTLGSNDLNKVIPSVSLRINNKNLYAGNVSSQQSTIVSGTHQFTWHSVLGSNGNYNTPVALNSSDFSKVQSATKDYLKYLGAPEPENLLDDIPYGQSASGSGTYSDVLDSAFINFRIKWVSGLGSTDGNRISNKYLYLLTKRISEVSGVPSTLTYTEDEDTGVDEITLFKYDIHGDGHNYSMGLSHITTSTGSSSHADYQYNKELLSSDGYYYYDADKTLPSADHSAQTVAQVQSYLNNSSVGTSEVKANWLEIEQNNVSVTVTNSSGNSVTNVFPDEIYLVGSGITLKGFSHVVPAVESGNAWTQAAVYNNGAGYPYTHNGVYAVAGARIDGSTSGIPNGYHTPIPYQAAYDAYVDASDQVLRVGNLYKKKDTSTILFAIVPDSVYSTASITLGRSNATSVTFYKAHNVNSVERVVDYANDSSNTKFRYVTHTLNASNACVSAPIIMEILDDLDPLEQHKLLIAGANLSLHLAYYDRIEKTWEQKARAATLEAIRIGAIVFAVASLGSATSLTVLAQNAIVAYATSIAVNAIIEQILVPIIVSNFGEDEALILLAIAAVAIAIYSSGGTAGLNQFPNQVALFTTTIDIMNQMYSLAVVQPGLIEMQKEQEEWAETDSELTEQEEAFQEEYAALFGTDDAPNHLLSLQIRAALNPMPASAYVNYHDTTLERQFDCYDYEKYNTLNVS